MASRMPFVHFKDDNGTRIYYATYTAYDGKLVLPQFIETGLHHFKFITLNGAAVQNKGMALLPAIKGRYTLCSASRTTKTFTSCFPTICISGTTPSSS